MRAGAVVAVSALVLSIGLSACGGDKNTGGAEAKSATPTVVASTNVWGSVAQAVAGDHAKVSSIITDPAADPHSFEASPSDAASIVDASLVVYNGGGYDHWVDDVLVGHPGVASIDAYKLLSATGEPNPANEHVFYDLGTVKAVATSIGDKLAQDDPAHAADYKTNVANFNRDADAIEQTEKSIRTTHPGAAVVATEPVAHYLLEAAGLTDKTPEGFASAVEQDTDPAPVDVAAMLDLINNRQVAAVVFNEQTITPVTKQVQAAAQSAGVPIVGVTETLPAGSTYLSWQRDTANRLAGALQQNR
ncbi:zinc ABC transporter substrate-binding protein [Mycobacterium sp. NBC_00419]